MRLRITRPTVGEQDRFVAINLVAPTAFRVINSANVNVLDGFHWVAAYTV